MSRVDYSLSSRFKPKKRADGSRPQLTPDQQQEIKEAFDLFDSEKTGKIDVHQFKVILRALGFEMKKPDVLKLLREFDRSNSGTLTYAEFVDCMTLQMQHRDPEQEMKKAFALFDEDQSGTINARSLRRIARELGENLSDEEVQAMIDEFDRNGDGLIDLDEFMAIMKQSAIY